MKALLLVLLLLFTSVTEARDYVPRGALTYKSYLIRTARFEFGMEAPVSALAGQIHQESAWNPRARSAFAAGLSQFTPETEKWIIGLFPDLGVEGVQDPHWAIRAMVRYDKRLVGQISADTPCDDWAFGLSAYNGGLGWVLRDKTYTQKRGGNRNRWWGQVETNPDPRRKPEFVKENRDYPVKILLRHQPKYKNAGWGETLICGEKL